MNTAAVALTRLELGQRAVMHVEALFPAAIVGGGIAALGAFAGERLGGPGWPGVIVGALLALWLVVIAPGRRWRAWGWALGPDELHVAHGVWTQVHTIVPLSRVQHIDIAQGPIERPFGVARLVLHTAGTLHAVVVLPGLSRGTAEAVRDTIRSRIREDGC